MQIYRLVSWILDFGWYILHSSIGFDEGWKFVCSSLFQYSGSALCVLHQFQVKPKIQICWKKTNMIVWVKLIFWLEITAKNFRCGLWLRRGKSPFFIWKGTAGCGYISKYSEFIICPKNCYIDLGGFPMQFHPHSSLTGITEVAERQLSHMTIIFILFV